MTATSEKTKTYLFHGPSGCGKDTQADLLIEKFDFEKIGTGDMFRALFEEGDPDGVKASELITKGIFVPDELTYKLLDKWLKKYDSDKSWMFISAVRTPEQIPLFDELMKKYDRELDKFVHFYLSEEAAVERMSLRWVCPECGTIYHEKYLKEKKKGYCDKDGEKLIQRDDDKPAAIKERLRQYDEMIKPILDEYRKRGILLEIDAAPSIEEIHKELVQKLALDEPQG